MSTLKVDGIRSNSATSDAITLADNGTCTANITNNLSNRNLIINGAMQVAQRGTSSTSLGYQTVDRITMYHGGTDEAPTYSQADVAAGTTPYSLGFRKCFKITNGNQTTPAAGDEIQCDYLIEAQDLANSGWNYTSSSSFITLSYWVKSSVAGEFKGHFKPNDGTQQNFSYSLGTLSANTWTKVTKTIPGNSNVQIDNDNGTGAQINLFSQMGTNFTSNSVTEDSWAAFSSGTRTRDQTLTWWINTGATFEITGVQLEVDHTGSGVATDFEHRSFRDELNRCLRYCYVAGGAGPATDNFERFGAGWGYDSTRTRIQIFHPIPMRTAPTVSIPTIGDLQASDSSNGFQCSAYERTGSVNGPMTTGIQFTHSSGVTAHRPMFVEARNTTAARIILSAEL